MKGKKNLKSIVVQVPVSCDLCRFNIKDEKDENVNYCLAYLKAIIKNEYGSCINVKDCIEVNKYDK